MCSSYNKRYLIQPVRKDQQVVKLTICIINVALLHHRKKIRDVRGVALV